MSTSNALLLLDLALEYALKLQQISSLLLKAQQEGRDVSDEEVAASAVARDAAITAARAATRA